MNLLDKIKLIIEARSSYVKKAFLADYIIAEIPRYYVFVKILNKDSRKQAEDMIQKYYKDIKIRRLLAWGRDEARLGTVIWYI